MIRQPMSQINPVAISEPVGRDLLTVQLARPSVVTIGSFDGVHRGHQALIAGVVDRARATGRLAVVVTFHPHPRTVLRLRPPDASFTYLQTLEERLRLVAELGVDEIVVVPFTVELSRQTADEFARSLRTRLQMAELWVGPGFAIGRQRHGTVPVLTTLGHQVGFVVHEVPPVLVDGQPVSSSRIREALQEGDVAQAAKLLGRRYSVRGPVVHGAGRGRKLGIPTANLEVPDWLYLPANGIYAVCVDLDGLDGRRLGGAASLGTRPMFDSGQRVLEVHVLDFEADLYGQWLTIEFVQWLRPEERFPSLAAFLDQVKRDIARTREIIAGIADCRS
ncbi:MAG: bifunctional riboflavin kinase/FAD synthetase [Chloroflexi bacterium]|nr:bifunctional riboflavin kinase/FAD synthetase [Chloroflexota bacterium]